MIALNLNCLTIPIKRQRLYQWMKKQDPTMLWTRNPLQTYRCGQVKSKGRGKIKHVNTNQKKDGIAISILDEVNFRTRKSIRHKEGHDIMIPVLILQKDITMCNVYEPNNRASKHLKHKMIEL